MPDTDIKLVCTMQIYGDERMVPSSAVSIQPEVVIAAKAGVTTARGDGGDRAFLSPSWALRGGWEFEADKPVCVKTRLE